jgi:hypothetical protein
MTAPEIKKPSPVPIIKKSDQSNQTNAPNDQSQSQTQNQNAPVAPTVLPARNPQMALDHALPKRNPEVIIKAPEKGDMEK